MYECDTYTFSIESSIQSFLLPFLFISSMGERVETATRSKRFKLYDLRYIIASYFLSLPRRGRSHVEHRGECFTSIKLITFNMRNSSLVCSTLIYHHFLFVLISFVCCFIAWVFLFFFIICLLFSRTQKFSSERCH
jgi:hypothetical protein